MTTFIVLATLLTLLVVAWLVWSLLRSATSAGVSSQQLNAALHRDQLSALEADLARAAISQQDFETTRDELQLRLLDDTESYAAKTTGAALSGRTDKRSAVIVALLVPLLAAGLYVKLGAPGAINPQAAAKVSDQQIQQMVESLAAKLKANPDNPKGWAMLARSYKVMNRFDEARQAFEKVGPLLNSEPDLLVEYADILALQANNSLAGKPLDLVNQALALNAKHPTALMMSGEAAFRRSDFKLAVAQWEKLLQVLPPGSDDARQIAANIAEAQTKGAMPLSQSAATAAAAGAMTPEKINEMVQGLAARLKDNPQDLAGWARLARAYKVQGRLDLARQAFEKTGKLLETDADLLTQYADLLAMQSSSLAGRPSELVNRALALDPKHPMALMMAGQAAFKAGKLAQAIAHWETVLTVLPPDSSDAQQVKEEIASAKASLGKN